MDTICGQQHLNDLYGGIQSNLSLAKLGQSQQQCLAQLVLVH